MIREEMPLFLSQTKNIICCLYIDLSRKYEYNGYINALTLQLIMRNRVTIFHNSNKDFTTLYRGRDDLQKKRNVIDGYREIGIPNGMRQYMRITYASRGMQRY